MAGRSVGLHILFWSEAIVSIRVLLFTVPVLINKCIDKIYSLSNLEDRFITLLTATAVIYILTGIVSIAGLRYWKSCHFLAAMLTLVLTVASLKLWGQASAPAGAYYFYPVLAAALVAVLAGLLAKNKQSGH